MAKRYMTAVIELPEDEEAALVVYRAMALGNNVYGGSAVAAYAGDAISENEIFERNADPRLVKAVRDEVAALSN